MAVQIVQELQEGVNTLDLQSGDCLLLFFLEGGPDYTAHASPENFVEIDEASAILTPISRDSIFPGCLFGGQLHGCYLHIGRITSGTHDVAITAPDGTTLRRGCLVRGTNGRMDMVKVAYNPSIFMPPAEYRLIWDAAPHLNLFYTAYPWTVDAPTPTALRLTYTEVKMIPPQGPITVLDGWVRLDDAPYGDLLAKIDDTASYNLEAVTPGEVMSAPAYSWAITDPNPQGYHYEILVYSTYWLFLEDNTAPPAGGEDDEIAGVTQVGAYLEGAPASTAGEQGATGVTQIGGYLESTSADRPDAAGVTQVGGYLESTSAHGPDAAGIAQIGRYIEAASADGADAAGVTQIGAYIEAAIDPDYVAEGIRISQALSLVEARRIPGTNVRISQAFSLVEARRAPDPELPTGDMPDSPFPSDQPPPPPPLRPSELPEPAIPPDIAPEALPRTEPAPLAPDVLQPPPAPPLRPSELPKPATAPDIAQEALPQTKPAPPAAPIPGLPKPPPVRPLQWAFSPPTPPSAPPSRQETGPQTPLDRTLQSGANLLDLVVANRSRAGLVATLAARLDAQSTPVKGTAIGANLALISGVPTQTTEAEPVAGRTGTYVNVGRAAKAIYTPEIQTPAAQKASRTTDTAADTTLTPASPTTRINLVYPLLGSGTLADDLTISLDPIGYRAQIAAVIEAIFVATVTVGYEVGAEPNTFNLYVLPGVLDAATLDGLTREDLKLIGSAQNQILRYNVDSAQWQPTSEPLAFKGVILTDADPPAQHGGFRYNPLTSSLSERQSCRCRIVALAGTPAVFERLTC